MKSGIVVEFKEGKKRKRKAMKNNEKQTIRLSKKMIINY